MKFDDETLVEALRRELGLAHPDSWVGAYVFGSQASGRARADSDLDLAFLARVPLEPARVFAAAQRLAEQLHVDVDLIDLARASSVLRAQVVGKGRKLGPPESRALDEFEMYALSDYARLNEERAATVEAFVKPYRDG